MKKLFFSLIATVMISTTISAKAIEIECAQNTIVNSIVHDEISNNEIDAHTLCWEISRSVRRISEIMIEVTIKYRCTEYPNSGFGNGTYYINSGGN
jgi:uncharacterized protein YcfL